MPWDVKRDTRCPASKPWGVVKKKDGKLEGCHETKEKARKQQEALYANESGASNEEMIGPNDMTPTGT